MNCKHCGKRVVRTNWARGPGWNHADGNPLCRIYRATPEIPDDPSNAVDPDALNPPAKAYELQQGGFWDYSTATDVYGNGKTWVPFKRKVDA